LQDALKHFKEEVEEFRLRSVYNVQNNKRESDAYMRELGRMQKLDHLRVQVSQKTDRSTWLNKTTNDFNQGSRLNTCENESLM